MKLSSGTLRFEDVKTPEGAKELASYLRETILPLPLFYMTRVEGNDEEGTTIEFRRREQR